MGGVGGERKEGGVRRKEEGGRREKARGKRKEERGRMEKRGGWKRKNRHREQTPRQSFKNNIAGNISNDVPMLEILQYFQKDSSNTYICFFPFSSKMNPTLKFTENVKCVVKIGGTVLNLIFEDLLVKGKVRQVI